MDVVDDGFHTKALAFDFSGPVQGRHVLQWLPGGDGGTEHRRVFDEAGNDVGAILHWHCLRRWVIGDEVNAQDAVYRVVSDDSLDVGGRGDLDAR